MKLELTEDELIVKDDFGNVEFTQKEVIMLFLVLKEQKYVSPAMRFLLKSIDKELDDYKRKAAEDEEFFRQM